MKSKVQFVIPCWIGDLTPYEQTKRLIEDVLSYEKQLKKELEELEKYKTKLALAIMGGGSMNEKLLMCPFCGGKAKVIDATDEWNETYFVLCQNCGANTTNGSIEQEAINAWNKRVDCKPKNQEV